MNINVCGMNRRLQNSHLSDFLFTLIIKGYKNPIPLESKYDIKKIRHKFIFTYKLRNP